MAPPLRFNPGQIINNWRDLAHQYQGTPEGERFERLINGLEQDHWATNWSDKSLNQCKTIKVKHVGDSAH
jgi:hypothetical protein